MHNEVAIFSQQNLKKHKGYFDTDQRNC